MVYYITKTSTTFCKDGVTLLRLVALQTQFVSQLAELLLQSDCVVLTSKNAIFALEDNLKHFATHTLFKKAQLHWKHLAHFVLGEASAKVVKDFGLNVAYVGKNAYSETFAQELIPLLQNRKPLFLRAKVIASTLPITLQAHGIPLKEAIVYAAIPQKLESLPTLQKGAIIFFSAPSHIQAFLLNFKWDSSFCALCIGSSTKRAAEKLLHNAKILQAPLPNINVALDFALSLKPNL